MPGPLPYSAPVRPPRDPVDSQIANENVARRDGQMSKATVRKATPLRAIDAGIEI